jgi:uncharacterized membrane protein YeaQ/YmgE (transglycosylase-associated protein family)
MFAEMALAPGGVISWLIVGLIAGWLTGLFMRGGGYGIVADTILGLIGAFLGGLICSFFVEGVAGFWGSIVVAFIGACILVAIVRALTPRRALPPR